MIVSREQIASLNFGYLSGTDLLQWCPDQLLTAAYAKDPNKIQLGCNQAYGYVKAKLCNRYDLNQVLSNSNQHFKAKTGSFQVSIAAGTYVSRINFANSQPSDIFHVVDVCSIVKIGTTDGASDILAQTTIQNGYLWFANKYFATATTLYFTLTGPPVDISLSATMGVQMPVAYPKYFNVSGLFQIVIPANTYIYMLFAEVLMNTPSIQIGTTLGGSDILPNILIDQNVTYLINQYYLNETTYFINVTNGSVNIRIDEGLNFIAPNPPEFEIKDDLLTEILSIRSIKCILGSNAGTNEQLKDLIEENEHIITQIQEGEMGLTLPSPPDSIHAIPYTVRSSFKTIG